MYTNSKLILCFALVPILSKPAFATTDPVWVASSLEQALQRAEANNPELEAAIQRFNAAREQIRVASALPDPVLTFGHFVEPVQTRTGSQEQVYALKQSFPAWGMIGARRSAAQNVASAQQHRYLGAVYALRQKVTDAYADAFYYEKACAATRESLKLIRAMRAVAEEQVRTGASLNTMLRFELLAEKSKDDLALWVQKSEAAHSRLASLLNMDGAALGSVANLDEASRDFAELSVMYARLRANNPELQALRGESAAAGDRIRQNRLERYPNFTVGLNYIDLDANASTAVDAGKNPWGVTLSVNLPLWQGKRNASVRAARARQQALNARLRQRELELRAELEAALSFYNTSHLRLRRYSERLIPLAEESLEHARNAYRTSLLGVLELLDSEQSLLDLRLRYWSALADTHRASAKLISLTASIPEIK